MNLIDALPADDTGVLPDAALESALATLRDALQRALVNSDVSLVLAAASCRFGICVHMAGTDGDIMLNAQGLGLGAWSLRNQQSAYVPAIAADARAAVAIDYDCARSDGRLPAVSVAIGECLLGGVPAWPAITARGAGLADPAAAAAMQAQLTALLRGLSTETLSPLDGRRARLFRASAFAAQRDDMQTLPLQLLLAPRWARHSGRVLAALLVLTLAAMFVPVRDRLGAAAVLRLEGLLEVSAAASGRVEALLVSPGQRVAAGAPLVQISDARSAKLSLLKADSAGRVLDVMASRGQRVDAGEGLLRFAPDDSVMQLELELPTRDATRLQPGSTGQARLESLPDRDFPIRMIWQAQVLAPRDANATQRVRARASFLGAAPTAMSGTGADLHFDLGSEPLYRLLFRRWNGD